MKIDKIVHESLGLFIAMTAAFGATTAVCHLFFQESEKYADDMFVLSACTFVSFCAAWVLGIIGLYKKRSRKFKEGQDDNDR